MTKDDFFRPVIKNGTVNQMNGCIINNTERPILTTTRLCEYLDGAVEQLHDILKCALQMSPDSSARLAYGFIVHPPEQIGQLFVFRECIRQR